MRTALVVDSPKRDLDGIVLTAYHLAQRGAEAFIVPMYQQGYDLPLLAPDGVLVNYARRNNRHLLETCRSLAIRVMVMDTEGGILSDSGVDSPAKWASELRRAGLAALIDDYFFWGPRVRQAFVEGSGIPAHRLHVTGCPRYDYCAHPWRGVLEFPDQGYALVNTNFSAINPRFTASREAEKAIFLRLGWSADYVEQLLSELEAVFPRYLDAIEQLAKARPNLRVRVRPHPFEKEDTYVRRFRSMANVIVDGAGNVLPAIASAACVLHLNCGTAIESLMLGTPAISLEFLNTEAMRSHAGLPSRVSLHARSQEELLAMVDASAQSGAKEAGGRPPLIAEHIEPWFHRIDGRAAERLADGMLAAIAGAKEPRRSIGAALRGSRPFSIGSIAAGAASQLLGSEKVGRLQCLRLPARREKAIHVNDVIRRLDALRRVDGEESPLSVGHARHPRTGASMAAIRVAAG